MLNTSNTRETLDKPLSEAGDAAAPRPFGCIVFVHIPKTAGGTITRIVEQNYPRDAIYRIEGDNRAAIERLLALGEAERHRFRCVIGHAPVGLEPHLRPPSAPFTLLRDPVARIVSMYNYIGRRPTHYLYKAVVGGKLSLEAFALSELTPELDNCQTRHLSGDPAVDCVFGAGPIDEGTFAAAKANIEHGCAAVGVQERFIDSLLVFGRVFGWKDLATVSKNAGPSERERTPVPDRIRQVIADRNPFDIALYQAAVARLDRDLAALGITPAAGAALREAMRAGGSVSQRRVLWWRLREAIESSPVAAPIAYRLLSLYRSAAGIKSVGGAERWQRDRGSGIGAAGSGQRDQGS